MAELSPLFMGTNSNWPQLFAAQPRVFAPRPVDSHFLFMMPYKYLFSFMKRPKPRNNLSNMNNMGFARYPWLWSEPDRNQPSRGKPAPAEPLFRDHAFDDRHGAPPRRASPRRKTPRRGADHGRGVVVDLHHREAPFGGAVGAEPEHAVDAVEPRDAGQSAPAEAVRTVRDAPASVTAS